MRHSFQFIHFTRWQPFVGLLDLLHFMGVENPTEPEEARVIQPPETEHISRTSPPSIERTSYAEAHGEASTGDAGRAARFRTLVEERLGEDARYLGAEVQTVEQAMQARRAGQGWPVRDEPAPSGEPDLSEHPEVRQRLRELVEAQYESWVSESIPALGGLTPLEAVQEAAGREKVEALIRQFERNGLRMTPPLDQGVIENLRERLGLG